MKDSSKNNKDENIHKSLWKNGYIWVAIIIAGLSLFFYLSNINHWIEWEYLKDSDNSFVAGLGAVGDYFGGVLNPLLTFITIILLIRSIELQRADFRKQLEEQQRQTTEFNTLAEAQEKQLTELKQQNKKQNEAIQLEAFERNFFSLLEQHNALLTDSFYQKIDELYDYLINSKKIKLAQITDEKLYENEIESFSKCIKKIEDKVKTLPITKYKPNKYEQTKEIHPAHIISLIYNKAIEKNKAIGKDKENKPIIDLNEIFDKHNNINTYLRLLFRILKYLHTKIDSINNIQYYSGLLRAFVSEKMLFIIAVNSSRKDENKTYDEYINLLSEFAFLEHININQLIREFEECLTTCSAQIKKYQEIEKAFFSYYNVFDQEKYHQTTNEEFPVIIKNYPDIKTDEPTSYINSEKRKELVENIFINLFFFNQSIKYNLLLNIKDLDNKCFGENVSVKTKIDVFINKYSAYKIEDIFFENII
jgi:hypothetical protein